MIAFGLMLLVAGLIVCVSEMRRRGVTAGFEAGVYMVAAGACMMIGGVAAFLWGLWGG